jgi:hypothetical protein
VASVVASDEEGVVERLLPLRHWLGADAGRNMEQGQARTRLICTLVALCGFVLAALFVDLPDLVVALAAVYTLYAIALAVDIDRRPAASRPTSASTSSPRSAGACALAGTTCFWPLPSPSPPWRTT